MRSVDLPALSALPRAPLAFEDAPRFERLLGRALAAGALAAGTSWFAFVLRRWPIDLVSATGDYVQALDGVLLPVSAGLLAAALPRARWALLLLVAGLASLLSRIQVGPALPVVALAAGAVFGFVATRRPLPSDLPGGRLVGTVGAAVALAVGLFVVRRLLGHGVFGPVFFGPLPLATAGAALALFATVGAGAAHLRLATDPVVRMRRRLALSGDLGALADRGLEAYQAALRSLEARGGPREEVATLRRQLKDVAERMLRLAAERQAIDRDLEAIPAEGLEEEMHRLTERLEAAEDPVVRRQYLSALEALRVQHTQLGRIRRGRDRVVAALHGQLALLEQTRTALVALRSADSNLLAGELQHVSQVLADANREMEAESRAVFDLPLPG